jgi:GDP-L-fucose synthase
VGAARGGGRHAGKGTAWRPVAGGFCIPIQFWKSTGVILSGKKVVVTGGTGFLGSHVVTELQQAGARTVGLGRSAYDLLDRAAIAQLLADHAPDAVVHVAGVVGGIGLNQREPGRLFYENAAMGLHLLEECRIHGVEKVLVVGTACSYPGETKIPTREEDLWSGYPEDTNAPYGLAKRMLLVQAQAYREQYGMNIIFLVPVNLYGPGDNFDLASGHVMPAMIRRFSEARDSGTASVTLWGDGSPTREFLHVKDGARALRMALELYDRSDPINVGSGREISIRDLAGLVAGAVGYKGSVAWNATRPNGQLRRLLDTSRAKEMFGFEAEVELEEGLAETVAWFEAKAGHMTSSV